MKQGAALSAPGCSALQMLLTQWVCRAVPHHSSLLGSGGWVMSSHCSSPGRGDGTCMVVPDQMDVG